MNLNDLLTHAYKNRVKPRNMTRAEARKEKFQRKVWNMMYAPEKGTIIRCTDRDYVVDAAGTWHRAERGGE